MKKIDVSKWNRKVHFECFSRYDHPTFSVSVRLDVTKLVEYTRKNKTHYFTDFLYIASRCLNDIDEFRYRIVDGEVVEFDKISPSFIVMNNDNVIVTCQSEYDSDYDKFSSANRADIEKAMEPDDRDSFNSTNNNDVFFVSCMPWMDFVCVTNPYDYKDDFFSSIPRLTWGKYVSDGQRYVMTMDISVHHGLMDGFSVAKAFDKIQKALDDVEKFLRNDF